MWMTSNFGSAASGASAYYRLLNSDKSVLAARTATGVVEDPAGSGVFGVEVADGTISGKAIVWDLDGTNMVSAETAVPPSGTGNILVLAAFGATNSGETCYYEILNSDGSTSVARTSTGVTEIVAGSGLYGVELALSALRGKTVVFDIGTGKAATISFLPAATGGTSNVFTTNRIMVR